MYSCSAWHVHSTVAAAAAVQTADSVEDDHLVFDLQPSSPRLRAELRDSDQHAALNKQLAQQIPELKTWQQLQQFVQEHGDQLNFLNVVGLVTRAAALQQVRHADSAAAERVFTTVSVCLKLVAALQGILYLLAQETCV
jgi:hypothetical protein